MEEQVYKKKGRKYIPLGYSDGFTGFPCEGIWIVYNRPNVKTQSCIAKVGDFDELEYKYLANLIKEREDECLEVLDKLFEKPHTRQEIVRTIFKELVKIKRDKNGK